MCTSDEPGREELQSIPDERYLGVLVRSDLKPSTQCVQVAETNHGKITRHYSRYCAVAFCYVLKCELSCMCPGHDIKLHPHRVKLYRIGCVGSGLVLAKALT